MTTIAAPRAKLYYYLNKRWYKKDHKLWLLGHVIKHKWKLILISIGALGSIILQTLIPFVLGATFDNIASTQSLQLVIQSGLIVLGLVLAKLVLNFMASALNEVTAQNVEMQIRIELYENLLSKNMDFHDSVNVGNVMSMATADTRMINGAVSPGVRMIVSTIFTLIATFIAMWLTSPALSLVFLLAMPFYFWALYRFGSKLLPLSKQRQAYVAKMNTELEESLTGIRVVRTFSGQEREIKKFKKTVKKLEEILIKRGMVSGFYVPSLVISVVTSLIFLAAVYLIEATILGPLGISIFGIKLTIEGISIGDLVTFLGLVGYLGMPTMFLRWITDMTLLGFAGAQRIFELLTTESSLDNGSYAPEEIRGEIEFENVFFSYKKDSPNVINGVSLKINPGETVALIGPTGCGKTTLWKLIMRFYDVNKGSIKIDGVDIREWDVNYLRSKIGVIEQDVFLFSTTVKNNIIYGKTDATEEEIIEAAKAAQAHEFIMKLPKGYDTLIGERGVTLSGGQKQRIAIARGFILNPKILIMDASTSAVDAQTEEKITAAIEKLLEGRTTIIITHRLSTLKTASKIVFMDKGKILRVGTHEELITSFEPYRNIFRRYMELPPLEIQEEALGESATR